MDYLGQNEDYRHRNRQRDTSHSRDDRHHYNHHDNRTSESRRSSSNRRSRSRSPMRSHSRSKSRQFYDSSQRAHHHNNTNSNNSQYNTPQQNSKHYNRYEAGDNGTGYNGNGQSNDTYNNSYYDHDNSYNNSGCAESGSSLGRPFNPGQPSRTIMLRQLPMELEDDELMTELNMERVPYRNVRLVKNRDTGLSRGFAFIEFGTVDEAQRWMAITQGWLMFRNYDSKIQMFYSSTKDDQASGRDDQPIATDWICSKCGIKNFKRRDQCFKCNITREESERKLIGDGYEHTGNTPCDTLVLRGLDTLTSEASLLTVVNTRTNFSLTVKNCYIARDPFTRMSRGFAFIEANSDQEADSLLGILKPDMEVDGRIIDVSFSKSSFTTALTKLQTENRLDHEPGSERSKYTSNNPFIPRANRNNKRANQADQANSAAAVAQAAMQNMHKKQELISHIASQLKQEQAPKIAAGSALYGGISERTNGGHLELTVNSNLQMLAQQATTVYAPPDPSKFVYDETSGFYYDYTTRFYYDAKSQYYFNSDIQQYMYWDAKKSTYIPVDQQSQQTPVDEASIEAAASVTPEPATPAVEEKPKNIPKTAAQIAKEMENWAKSQNTKKTTFSMKKTTTPKQQQTAAFVPQSTAAKSSFESIDSKVVAEPVQVEEPNSPVPETPLPQEIKLASSDPESSNDSTVDRSPASRPNDREETLRTLIDTTKMACLLCKRRFDSLEVLNKHIAKSDLHKKNLEKFNQENSVQAAEKEVNPEERQMTEEDSLLAALKYRDRASERRMKYGKPELSSSAKKPKKRENKKRDIEEVDYYSAQIAATTNSTSILDKSDSVASKLMRKMGWNEGSGLGKNMQGISAPIQATMRQKGAGLGSTAASYDMDPNDTYSDAVRKSARARYESLQE